MEEGSDVAAGFGGVLPETGEMASGESVTNEANFDENVNSSNFSTDIGLTTNSGVDSGLDKGEIDHDFDGGETDCGEAFRECQSPTEDAGEPHTTDCGDFSPVRRPPTTACGGTSPTGGAEELLAIETVKRQARAGPMADAIRDSLASSPEAMELLKEFLPRGP